MTTVPGRRQLNRIARIARARPPLRNETDLSTQAVEYDLQQVLTEAQIAALIRKVIDSGGGGGGRAVFDVDLTMPVEYLVTKISTIATITLQVTWLVENANKIFAGPASGSPAAPTFRDQVNLDLPARSRIGIIPIPFAATIVPDGSLGSEFSILATGDFTLNPPSNMLDGQKFTIRITQDGVGGHVMTLGFAYRFSTYLTPTLIQLTATPNATDYLGFQENFDTGTVDILSWVPGVQ